MNLYIAFHKAKSIQVQAATTYEAQTKAAKLLKARKQYEVNVFLIHNDNGPVVHRPDF